jgi:hypothetical protein
VSDKKASEVQHLIQYAFAQGCTVSIYDGMEWSVKKSKDLSECMAVLNDLDEARIRIRKGDEIVAWAYFVAGNDPDEEVADHGDNAWMAVWSNAYRESIGEEPWSTAEDIAALEVADAERKARQEAAR